MMLNLVKKNKDYIRFESNPNNQHMKKQRIGIHKFDTAKSNKYLTLFQIPQKVFTHQKSHMTTFLYLNKN